MSYFGFLTFPKMFLKNFFFDPNRVEIEGFGGRKRVFWPFRGGFGGPPKWPFRDLSEKYVVAESGVWQGMRTKGGVCQQAVYTAVDPP